MQGSLMPDVGGTQLTAEDRRILRRPEVGRLTIFAYNIEHPTQVRELCAAIRAIRSDLLLAVDQEEGRVQHLHRGSVRLPAMRAIAGNPNAEELAEYCGWLMTTEAQAVGLDLSFALVLDLDHQRSIVVDSRVFESDPGRAALFAGVFIHNTHAAGIAAIDKHFPGHGWTEADSRAAIPGDMHSLGEIRCSDLVPLAHPVGQLDTLMPAHIIYPQIDPQSVGPSRRWLQETLRGELKFDGTIFSDDLPMAGAHVIGNATSRIEAALAAGCDMGLACNVRAPAESALAALQRLKVAPPSHLQHMRSKGYANTDYRQQLRWLEALSTLRAAQLID